MAKSISKKTIQAVSDTTDFVSLVENYTKLERRGSLWWGCCPFHNEKTPSFQIDPEKKLFYCFGCHKGGSLFHFFMEVEQLSFVQTVVELAKRSNVEVTYDGSNYIPDETEKLKDEILLLYEKVANSFNHILLNTKEGENALNYLKNRKVSDDIIKNFKLGLSPKNRKWLYKFLLDKGYAKDFLQKTGLFSRNYPEIAFFSNRIMFPISDRHGRIIAFGGRTLSNDEKDPKYLNSSDMVQYQKKYNLFGLSQSIQTIRKERAIILCEGYMDVIAFHQAGIQNACAPLGTALTQEQISIVSRLVDKIYLCFDTDEAGVTATLRAIELIAKTDIETLIITDLPGKDPGEVFEKNGCEGLKNIVKNAIISQDFFLQIAMTRFNITNAEGKAKACEFLFSYLNSISSQVKRETTLQNFAQKLGVTTEAFTKDFISKTVKSKSNIKSSQVVEKKEIPLQKNFEIRAVLAVATKQSLFKKMRSQLSSDDFTDPYAKSLFITLEECYREEVETYEELIKRCTDEKIKEAIVSSVISGEFSNNTENIVDDSISQIKISNLKRRREALVQRLSLLTSNSKGLTDEEECSNLAADIADFDRQILSLKSKERYDSYRNSY